MLQLLDRVAAEVRWLDSSSSGWLHNVSAVTGFSRICLPWLVSLRHVARRDTTAPRVKGVPSRPRISVIGSSVLGQTLAKHGCSVWVARGASDPVLGAVGAIAFFASPVGIRLEVVPEGESSAPNQSACPRFCSFIGYAHLCSNLAPRRMSVILCLSATVSLCGRRHAPRSRLGVSAARWISRYQTGVCTFALCCLRSACVSC
jgi:hypothetical protein